MKGDDQVVTTTAGIEPKALSVITFPVEIHTTPSRWLGSTQIKADPETAYFVRPMRGHLKRVTRSEARALDAWNGGTK